MIRTPLPEQSRTSEPAFQPAPNATAINPLDAIRILRSAGRALFAHAALHGQLVRIEWAEEKIRLLKMLVVTLLGFVCLLCVMLSVGALVISSCWDTVYRIPVVMALIAVYAIGMGIAWRRFLALSAQSDRSFATTRLELAADMAVLKSKL